MATIAESADVSPDARIGDDTKIWHLAQVREGADIGDRCIVGRGAYIGSGVHLGDDCKIQNYALIYEPAMLADGVFVGPAAVLTNDTYPRAIAPDGWIEPGVGLGARRRHDRTRRLHRRPRRLRCTGHDRGVVDGRGGCRRHEGRTGIRPRRRSPRAKDPLGGSSRRAAGAGRRRGMGVSADRRSLLGVERRGPRGR